MESYIKHKLQTSEDLYTNNPTLHTLFPQCAKPSDYKSKPWITFQQIFEINVTYRKKIRDKFADHPDLLAEFNTKHQTTYTIDIITALIWTPFLIFLQVIH